MVFFLFSFCSRHIPASLKSTSEILAFSVVPIGLDLSFSSCEPESTSTSFMRLFLPFNMTWWNITPNPFKTLIIKLWKAYGCFNHFQMPPNLHHGASGVCRVWDVLAGRQPGIKDARGSAEGRAEGKDYYQHTGRFYKLAEVLGLGTAGVERALSHRRKRKEHVSSFLTQFE